MPLRSRAMNRAFVLLVTVVTVYFLAMHHGADVVDGNGNVAVVAKNAADAKPATNARLLQRHALQTANTRTAKDKDKKNSNSNSNEVSNNGKAKQQAKDLRPFKYEDENEYKQQLQERERQEHLLHEQKEQQRRQQAEQQPPQQPEEKPRPPRRQRPQVVQQQQQEVQEVPKPQPPRRLPQHDLPEEIHEAPKEPEDQHEELDEHDDTDLAVAVANAKADPVVDKEAEAAVLQALYKDLDERLAPQMNAKHEIIQTKWSDFTPNINIQLSSQDVGLIHSDFQRLQKELEHIYAIPKQPSLRQMIHTRHVMKHALDCVNEEYRNKFITDENRKLLFDFVTLAERAGVEYGITTGSLFGAKFLGGPLPWDLDFDIIVNKRDIPKLLALSEPLPFTSETSHLYVLPDTDLPEHERARKDCHGNPKKEQVDHCSFTEPVARMIGHPPETSNHLDIFAFIELDQPDPDHDNKDLFLDLELKIYFHKQDFIPFQRCMFWGMEVACPANPTAVCEDKYGKDYEKFFYEYVCVDGIWRRAIDVHK